MKQKWFLKTSGVPSAVHTFFLLFQAAYIRIDGSVPSSERIQLVNKFQSDPQTRVAILSIQAAGQVLRHTHTLWLNIIFYFTRVIK